MSSQVNIIMSTYNGEKYLREQLNTLLQQTYDNIQIFVRDDGSTDGTMRILWEYEQKAGIHVLEGKNLGFAGSFMEMLHIASEGDYWAFCDQGDLWFSNKVALAVEWLDGQEQDIPLLYYSLSEMIDEHGNGLGIQKPPKGSLTFERAMTGTFGVGFSMVINQRLREEMLKCDPKKVHSHDWLAGAVALGLGIVHVNNTICAKYRRLDSSVTRISLKKKVKWAIQTFKDDGDVADRNREYYNVYKSELSSEKVKVAELFGKDKFSVSQRLVKAFYPRRWRPGIASEVVMRVMMMLGKV